MFDRVSFSPQIMGGRACIRGMRITISLIVNFVANGMTTEEILKEFPDLEPEDVRQALQYAAALANDEFYPFTGSQPFVRFFALPSPIRSLMIKSVSVMRLICRKMLK